MTSTEHRTYLERMAKMLKSSPDDPGYWAEVGNLAFLIYTGGRVDVKVRQEGESFVVTNNMS